MARIVNASVTVRDGETIESALERFKRQVNNSGALKKYKDNQYFMTKAEKRENKRQSNDQ